MIDSSNEKLNWLLITEKHVDVFICLESGKQKKNRNFIESIMVTLPILMVLYLHSNDDDDDD